MIDWQTLLSLLIVAVAVIQLVRLLVGRKSKCGNCSDRCSSPENKNDSLIQLDDLTSSKKVQP